MDIRILQPGDQEALEAFLGERLATSMFLLGNSRRAGLIDRGELFQGTYAAAFQGERITAVVAHYWQQHFIIQAPHDVGPLIRAAMAASGRPFKGILGPPDQVAAAIGELGLHWTADQAQLDEPHCLYHLRLDELTPPGALSSGRLVTRRAEAGDVDLLARWRTDYCIETLGFENNAKLHQKSLKDAADITAEGRFWLALDAGEPVACSAFNARIDEAVQIGGVFTPPPLRSRGYARAAVAGSLLEAHREGTPQAILFTPNENLPARRTYESLGFRPHSDYQITLLHEPLPLDS